MPDVIVIGAGPAGSSAATMLARRGWQVALLECGERPGMRKACGGGLEGPDAEWLELPDELVHGRLVCRKHFFPWGQTTLSLPHVNTLRQELDAWLAGQAEAAGAQLVCARAKSVQHVNQDKLEVLITGKGVEQTLAAHLVIFADGARTLARQCGSLGFAPRRGNTAIGVVYELAWPEPSPDFYEIHFGATWSRWGYVWIFPKRGMVNVGIMALLEDGARAEERLRAFIAGRPDLRDRPILRHIGGLIPLSPASRIYADGLLAAGDAAGMVEALSGAGIAYAAASGRLAGEVACEALEANEFTTAFLSRYQRRWEATPRFRNLRFQAMLTRVALPLARRDGNLYAKLLQVFFLGGELSRREKLCVLTWGFNANERIHRAA